MRRINVETLKGLHKRDAEDWVHPDDQVVVMWNEEYDVTNRVYVVWRQVGSGHDYAVAAGWEDYHDISTFYGTLQDYRRAGFRNGLRGHGRGGSWTQFKSILRRKGKLGYQIIWSMNVPHIDGAVYYPEQENSDE